jgi:pyridoxal phosphate enzyme (YggS family)
MKETLAQRLAEIRAQIAQAAERAGRDAREIKLVAVSKTHGAATVREAIAAGAQAFGENKVQEAEEKIAEIGRERAEWHLIGHLQSNKARKAVRLFDVIHSLDSLELAERLERICEEEGRARLAVFVQIDLGRERTKNGIEEKDVPALVEFLRGSKHLKFDGLMILPPFFEDSELARPFFRRLREIRDALCPAGELSMGMSHDFPVAIEEGATLIRVGTAIFGERSYRN